MIDSPCGVVTAIKISLVGTGLSRFPPFCKEGVNIFGNLGGDAGWPAISARWRPAVAHLLRVRPGDGFEVKGYPAGLSTD